MSSRLSTGRESSELGLLHQNSLLARQASLASLDGAPSEVDCLLPSPVAGGGQHAKASRHAHRRSLSNTLWAFSVEYKPRKALQGVAVEEVERQASESNEASHDEQRFFKEVVASTYEWLTTAATLVPKISWGWLPFGFTFLGLGAASKLLLFITMFAVYCSALMYRLFQHTDNARDMAAMGQEAFGHFGRRLVDSLNLAINVALPVVCHVGGTRYLQWFAFAGTGVCLPWLSLLFGVLVLVLGQIQRLGPHPKVTTVVVPALAYCAVGLTITKLLLLKAAGPPTDNIEEEGLIYISDYALAVISLISANYFGQHLFVETMANMEHPASFPHSTATAQVITLLLNVGVGVASLHIPHLKVKGFIAFAFAPQDFLTRLINFFMCLVMTLKYVSILNVQTKGLIPWLPHTISQVMDPSGVESSLAIKPRQLWLIASSMVVTYSYLIANTFPHTFMGLSGLLTSLAYIPMAYTLPCLFSIKLLSHNISALEYSLAACVVPVSIMMSLVGVWASIYHLVTKWNQTGAAAGCWGCNAL